VEAAHSDARIDDAMKRAGLVWIRVDDASDASPRWHVWRDGRAYLLTGGIEQPSIPGMERASGTIGVTVEVTVATSDHAARALTWPATVRIVAPGTDEWNTAVPVLRRARLNAPDGDAAAPRWERECVLFALEPAGPPTAVAPA
jgi:hypothetical protein